MSKTFIQKIMNFITTLGAKPDDSPDTLGNQEPFASQHPCDQHSLSIRNRPHLYLLSRAFYRNPVRQLRYFCTDQPVDLCSNLQGSSHPCQIPGDKRTPGRSDRNHRPWRHC